MNRTLTKSLRTTLTVIAVLVAISAAVALAFLGLMQWLPDEIGSGRIQWDDHSIALSNVFSGGLPDFFFAFGLATLAVLITIAATIFGVVVAVVLITLMSGIVVAALGLVAVVLGFPFLLVGGIMWWVVHRNKRPASIASRGAQA